MEREMDLLRQRIKADRQRSDKERLELLAAMQSAMGEAKRRQAEQESAMRRHSAFLRRCRAEAGSAKAAFEADVRRRQAYFDQSAAHAARREADREEHADEQRRRAEHAHEYGLPTLASCPLPLVVATLQQERQYDAFEAAFAAFEAAPDDLPRYGLDSFPCPPAGCPVSGVRKGDGAERRKQLLKHALLRWHPDKFAAAHGGKLLASDRDAIMEKVNAVLRRVQAERATCVDGGWSAQHGAASTPFTPSPSGSVDAQAASRRAAAAAAARCMPSSRPRMPTVSRATGPKVMRPSRAAAAAAAAEATPDRHQYDGRFGTS